MTKYLLEDNWYIVKDNYSWNLAKRRKNPKEKNEWDYNSMTYHATPEQAIAFYLKNCRSEALGSVESGTIEDILNIITAENKRLLFTLSQRFNEILEKGDNGNR